eukprot:1188528-Prorocentrum_minimum.AAC.3
MSSRGFWLGYYGYLRRDGNVMVPAQPKKFCTSKQQPGKCRYVSRLSLRQCYKKERLLKRSTLSAVGYALCRAGVADTNNGRDWRGVSRRAEVVNTAHHCTGELHKQHTRVVGKEKTRVRIAWCMIGHIWLVPRHKRGCLTSRTCENGTAGLERVSLTGSAVKWSRASSCSSLLRAYIYYAYEQITVVERILLVIRFHRCAHQNGWPHHWSMCLDFACWGCWDPGRALVFLATRRSCLPSNQTVSSGAVPAERGGRGGGLRCSTQGSSHLSFRRQSSAVGGAFSVQAKVIERVPSDGSLIILTPPSRCTYSTPQPLKENRWRQMKWLPAGSIRRTYPMVRGRVPAGGQQIGEFRGTDFGSGASGTGHHVGRSTDVIKSPGTTSNIESTSSASWGLRFKITYRSAYFGMSPVLQACAHPRTASVTTSSRTCLNFYDLVHGKISHNGHPRPEFAPTPSQAPESTIGRPMAVRRQGIYVEYLVEYSKCCALNGSLVSTVDC